MAVYECLVCNNRLKTLMGIKDHMSGCGLGSQKRRLLMSFFEKNQRNRGILSAENLIKSLTRIKKEDLIVLTDHHCQLCSKKSVPLDVHHIKPRSECGNNSPANLIVLCPNCHRQVNEYERWARDRVGSPPQRLSKYSRHNLYGSQGDYVWRYP